jgi:hypothetical protein
VWLVGVRARSLSACPLDRRWDRLRLAIMIAARFRAHGRSALRGALAGLAMAGACLVVGVVRAFKITLHGGHVSPPSHTDITAILFYVGGFTIAGVFIGLTWPMLRGKIAKSLAFVAGGVVLVYAIAVGTEGSWSALDTADYVFIALFGAALGLAAVSGHFTRP